METSVPSHENRSYFVEQLAKGQQYLNPFTLLGLVPDDIFLAQFGARAHCERVRSLSPISQESIYLIRRMRVASRRT